jgi:purine-binding chemotaxis protein CheW
MSGALHLLAQVGGRAIAVPADTVESVVDIPTIVAAPRTHPAVRGVAALRSRVVTVIDTWRVLDLPRSSAEARRAIITIVDGHHHAILVDALEDVAPLDVQPIRAGLTLGPNWASVATGSADHDGEPLLVIDLAELVRSLATAD